MRFFEWMGATIAIAGLAMSVQVANAQQCDLNVQTSCVVDLVVISGSGGGGGGGGGTGYPGFGGGGGGDMVLVAWGDRSQPACPNETAAVSFLVNYLVFNAMTGGNNSRGGTIIMFGPFGDSSFQGPAWVKYDYNPVSSIYNSQSGQTTTLSVHLHYMYNIATREFDQIRFKNTVQSGCG